MSTCYLIKFYQKRHAEDEEQIATVRRTIDRLELLQAKLQLSSDEDFDWDASLKLDVEILQQLMLEGSLLEYNAKLAQKLADLHMEAGDF